MNRKQVLVVTETLGVDGPERVISELTQEWARKGYSITVVVTRKKNKIATYDFISEVSMQYIDAYEKGGKAYRVKEIVQLRKILKEVRPDVCVSLMISTSFSLAIASIGLPVKVILSERNDPNIVPFTRFQRKLRDFSFELADAVVFQTKDAMDYFPERIRRKGTIIYNPVNPNLPEQHQGEREKKIVAVGRLADQKNFPMLIKAFGMLGKEHPEYELTIYGEGNRRPMLEELVQELGLADKVHMPGFCSSVYEEMVKSAMYVSSSNHEGMSNSMLEALAMGVPTICTDCPIGGAHTVIENGVNGVLVSVGDVQGLYEAITKVVEDAAFAQKIGMQAYSIRKKLNIQDIAIQWEKMF